MPVDDEVFSEAIADWAMLEELGFRDFNLISGDEWRRKHRLAASQKYVRSVWTADGEWVESDVYARDVVCVISAVALRQIYFEGSFESGTWDASIEKVLIRHRKENLHFLATSFGYGYGLGAIEDDEIMFWPRRDLAEVLDSPSLQSSRTAQMQHWLWRHLGALVKDRAQGRCQDCGARTSELDAHHTYYRWGRLYWQYPPQSLLALCRRCHAHRHGVERKWRLLLAKLKASEIEIAAEAIAESTSAFCPAFGEREQGQRLRFFELLRRFHFPCGIQTHLMQLLALADRVWCPEPRDEDEASGRYWWKRIDVSNARARDNADP